LQRGAALGNCMGRDETRQRLGVRRPSAALGTIGVWEKAPEGRRSPGRFANFQRAVTSADLLFGKHVLLRKGNKNYVVVTAK